MGDMNFPDSPELEQPYLDWSWDGEKWVHKGLTGIESKPANITTADVKLKNPQRSDFETQEDANNYFYEAIENGGGGGDVDLSPYINRNVRNDVLEGTFQIIWDDSADPTYPFNGRIGYNKNAQDPNSLDGSFLYVNGNRGTFSVGRDGDVELHGPSEIQGIADRLTGDKPWITGFSYVQADDFLDADGNSIIGAGGDSLWEVYRQTDPDEKGRYREYIHPKNQKADSPGSLSISYIVDESVPNPVTQANFSTSTGTITHLNSDELDSIYGEIFTFRSVRQVVAESTVLGGINITALDQERPEELPFGVKQDEAARSIQHALTVTHETLGRTVEIDKEGTIRARAFTDMDGNPIGGGGGGGYDDTQIKADLAQETQDRISGDDSLQKQINSLSGGGGGNDPRITDTQIGNWDTAYGWGNHASKGYLTSASLSGYATQTWVSQNYQPKGSYLTSESDPTVPPHVKSISQADINKWNSPPSGGGDDPNAVKLTGDQTVMGVKKFLGGSTIFQNLFIEGVPAGGVGFTGKSRIEFSSNETTLYGSSNTLQVNSAGTSITGGIVCTGTIKSVDNVGGTSFSSTVNGVKLLTLYGYAIANDGANGAGLYFSKNESSPTITPCRGSDFARVDDTISLGNPQLRFKKIWSASGVGALKRHTQNENEAVLSVNDLIDVLHSLREATQEEKTVEGLRDSIGNCVGGIIEKLEAIQAETEEQLAQELEMYSDEDEPMPPLIKPNPITDGEI
jgi:hypothetical protein